MSLQRFAFAGLLVGISGCMSLRPVASPAQYIPQANPSLVYVTYTDNSIVPVAQPKVTGDTLRGIWQGLSEPVAIPFREIQLVQARQPAKGKTRLLIFGLTALAAGGVYAIVKATGSSQPPCSGPGLPGQDPC